MTGGLAVVAVRGGRLLRLIFPTRQVGFAFWQCQLVEERTLDSPGIPAGVVASIGNTPVVELTRLTGGNGVRVLVKLEGSNPGGSVKDRIAKHMIEKAEASGDLTPDKIILEATSGNTGIGLAMVGAAKGYKVKLTMPACVSIERRQVLSVFGAELELTPQAEGTDGAIRKARQIIEEDPDTYFMPDQFRNENNLLAHYETTGVEIIEQTAGEVDVFVAGMGTTGTLMGIARRLKEDCPDSKVVGIEPVPGHTIQGLKNMTEAIVPDIYDPKALDEKITIEDDAAYDTSCRLAVEEGLFVGMSSGAAVWGALEMAKQMKSGTVVALLPDRGDRYLSTSLFRSICGKCPP